MSTPIFATSLWAEECKRQLCMGPVAAVSWCSRPRVIASPWVCAGPDNIQPKGCDIPASAAVPQSRSCVWLFSSPLDCSPPRRLWGHRRPWLFADTFCFRSPLLTVMKAPPGKDWGHSGQHPLGTDAFSPTAHGELNLANNRWVSLEASFTPVELGVEPCSLCLHPDGSLAKDPAEQETQLPHNLWDNIHVLSHANKFGKICYTATEK